MKVMLDTNTVSHLLRGNQTVMTNLKQLTLSDIFISVITEAELRYGVAKRPDALKLQKLVKAFLLRASILVWDSGSAKTYAFLRSSIENKGLCLSALDLLIASHALHHECVLVTNDKAFKKINEIDVMDFTKENTFLQP